MASIILDDLRHYLVFRIADSLFGWPADLVREVVSCPDVVRLPRSPELLHGVVHVGNRLLPVVDLSSLVGEPRQTLRWPILLVTSDSTGDIGIGIDQGLSVEPLETSFRPETVTQDDLGESIVGTAGFERGVVRVLDPETVIRLVRNRLSSAWSASRWHGTHWQTGGQSNPETPDDPSAESAESDDRSV